jgi:hypothetical protein
MLDPEPAPETPEELAGPRYALGEQFSKGGMGGLWYARESATGRTIALKRILGRPDAESFRRFLNEARITARLEHPNIVPVHGLGTDPDGHPFYTMKLVQGTDLAGVLKKLAQGELETVARYPLAPATPLAPRTIWLLSRLAAIFICTTPAPTSTRSAPCFTRSSRCGGLFRARRCTRFFPVSSTAISIRSCFPAATLRSKTTTFLSSVVQSPSRRQERGFARALGAADSNPAVLFP